VELFQEKNQPVISVEAKKKELVGDFKNNGYFYCHMGYNTVEVGILKNMLKLRAERNVALLGSELARIEQELKDLGARKIIHFGSSARGKAGPDSDLDLIVVMHSEDNFPDRIGALYKRIRPRAAVDLLVYTPAEFEEMKENNPFLINVLREGKILYEAEL